MYRERGLDWPKQEQFSTASINAITDLSLQDSLIEKWYEHIMET